MRWPVLIALTVACVSSPSFAGDWVTHPQTVADAGTQAVTLQFRRDFTLDRTPRQLKVNVTADNRYILYVNGHRVAAGPSRGDLAHWRTVELDLAPYLRRGENSLAVEVWNDGRAKPGAQVSARTAFRLEAATAHYQALLDTGTSDWRVRQDTSRSVASGLQQVIRAVGPTGYYVAGAPETIDASQALIDWSGPEGLRAMDWTQPQRAVPSDATSPWSLVQDALPQMRFTPTAVGRVVRAQGLDASGFPERPVTIPANATVKILIDSGRVHAAYPEYRVSGGKGSVINATYAEALYDAQRQRLADRSAVGDGQALGLTDTFKPDGRSQTLRPLWWRGWRFLELTVQTSDEPLTLEGLAAFETGYPFETKARFESDDPDLAAIWRIGWDTVRFDAHETYMDTAYWEQLQYIGDTRIQALVSYDVSGDARLAVQAIDAFNHSRVVDGLPQGAWPSNGKNSIPPFALLWIGMVHDYWMRQPEAGVVSRNLDGVRAVLDWYAPYLTEAGLVGQSPGWLFIDWRTGLSEQPRRSDPPRAPSCIISLMYRGALLEAADLEAAVGDPAKAEADRRLALKVGEGVQAACWDGQRGLYADTPEKAAFSQHANVLAVLYDVAPKDQQQAILNRVLAPGEGIDAPEGVTGTTYYFAFYLMRALDHAGLADRYIDLLSTWRRLLSQNFTTWPESPDPTRSDSHAWSAHPTSDLLGLVAGVQPDAPGYERVRIAPHLGELKRLDATVAHPKGLIRTRYAEKGGRLHVVIELPRGVTGRFDWNGQTRQLRSGANRFVVRVD